MPLYNPPGGSGVIRNVLWLWGRVNIAASLTNSTLDMFADATVPGAIPRQILIARTGTLTGLYVNMSDNAAGANITFTIFINGVASAATITINIGSSAGFSIAFNVALAANDLVDIRMTTPAGWTATTVDCIAAIEYQDAA